MTVQELVERYHDHRESYKSTAYKEAQLREEFINPFWHELGWDMTNRLGLAEAYKEVIHEDSLRIDGGIKAPDYVFRVGSERKFFLEVKAPKVSIGRDVAPAYQLKRYAWSAGLSLSLLSDFEEFAVYQTTAVPKPNDAPYKDRIEFFTFEKYAEKWNWLMENFSREAIWKGRFDKYAAQAKGKRGTTPFDKQFLADMLAWRKTLAENIALRNKGISEGELNFAVQVTLDRIIMLRICEDRKIEQYGNLAVDAGLQHVLGLKREKVSGVYKNLLNRFRQADDRFNSGLFHFKKEKDRTQFDALTPRLAIDDRVLTDVIQHLYYPESPYAFDIVPSDILGHVYEQFLGQVITLTKGGYARVEEKPEVKKAGGVYYTPTYIVDYIVKNTVGKILEDNSAPARVQARASLPALPDRREAGKEALPGTRAGVVPSLKILDPACGSGSFLLGAYQYLLDWYLKFYHEDPEKWAKKKILDRLPTANPNIKDYRLSIAERKRILLDHIHGVDIDSSAVEVAKLNLMLKVLEGGATGGKESEHRLAYDVSERLLPDLDKNIVCGNSLIGLDYFEQLETEPDMSERARINAMDWQQVFPTIMKAGGFDVVIGNPPYGFHQIHGDGAKEYFKSHYASSQGSFEHYFLFYEASLHLLKPGGFHGYIVPVTWLTIPSALSLRRFILEKFAVREIVWLPALVFENAQVNTLISIIQRSTPSKTRIDIYDSLEFKDLPSASRERDQSFFVEDGNTIQIFQSESDSTLVRKIQEHSVLLSSLAHPCSGYNPYEVGKGEKPGGGQHTKQTVLDKPYHSAKKQGQLWKPEIVGRDLHRYHVGVTGERWIKYGPWLAAARDPENFLGERILVQEITGGNDRRIVAAYYNGELYHSRDVIPIKVDSKQVDPYYLLAIINSRLITWYHHRVSPKAQKGLFPKVLVSDLSKLPIRHPDSNDKAFVSLAAKIHSKVSRIIDLKAEDSRPQDRTLLDRQLAATDREIDRLVYELYGLTEEEIGIVEGE